MARETLRDTPKGPGSSDPTFTQQVSVQPVNPSFRPIKDQLQKLREGLLAAGTALASGLAATANQRALLDRRKKEVVAKQEKQIAEVQQAKNAEVNLQTQRHLERQIAKAQDLQLDVRAEEPEWLLQQSSIEFNNAQTIEERKLWFSVLNHAQSRVKRAERDADRDLLEDINTAAMTSLQVIQQAGIELQNDVGLQAELIGDGENIPGRVQDWVLSLVQDANPELFDIREGTENVEERTKQRDHLMAQLIKATNPISSRLMKQYVREVNNQNEVTAEQKFDAAFTGALTGNHAGAVEMEASLEEIETTLMTHMTEGNKVRLLNRSVSKALRAAADGGIDKDIPTRIIASEIILEASGLSEVDQANARVKFQEEIMRAVRTGFIDAAKERVLTLSKTQIDSDPSSPFFGQVRSDLPDPAAAQTLALEGGYFQVAREYLNSIGMDPEDDNPMVRAVIEEAQDLVSRGMSAARADIERERSIQNYIGNANGGDGTASYEASAAFMSQTPGGMDEDSLARLQRYLPEDQASSLNTLIGGPIAQVPETRVVRSVVWGGLAKEINQAVNYALPTELMFKLGNDWKNGNQEDMFNVVSFYRQLQNKQKFLTEFSEEHGLAASVALNIATNKLFKARASGPVPDWNETVQDAQNIMSRAELLSPGALAKTATDEQGRILVQEGFGGREFPITRKQRIVTEIMGAIQQSDLLVDPLNLHPDKDLDVYFGVPKDEQGLFSKGWSLLTKMNIVSVSEALIGQTTSTIRFKSAEESTPAEIEVFLDQALQGFGNAELDNLVFIAAALEDSGMSRDDAAIGVVAFMANAGITVADTGSGVKLRFDPLGALGPNRQNFALLKNDVNVYLSRGFKPEDFVALNAKFGDTKREFKDPGFMATEFTHVPHLVRPDKFLSPDNPNWVAPEWRFATEEAAWQQGVNNGGAPLMFLTQDDNPQWVMVTDPRTQMPVFGFNAHELNAPSQTLRGQFKELSARIGIPGLVSNVVQIQQSAAEFIFGEQEEDN